MSTPPVLDPRDEDTLVASVIDALPAELSDRSRANPLVKAIEAMGAFYGQVLYRLNLWPEALEVKIIDLLGIEREPATAATVELTLTSGAGSTGVIVVPLGAVFKSGTEQDDPEFSTLAEVIVPPGGGSVVVSAKATAAGVASNAAVGTITGFDVPIPGVASVTNVEAAQGGQDEESLVQLRQRTALEVRSQDRIITAEDVESEAARVPGIARAKAIGATYELNGGLGAAVGVTAVGVLFDGTLNQFGLPAGNKQDIVDTLSEKSVPGMQYTPFATEVRLIMIEEVRVTLERGAVFTDVKARIEAALVNYLTAYDIIADNGRDILGTGWEWGQPMYRNEIISLIDRIEGVKRVVYVAFRQSDDFGASWSPPPLVDAEELTEDVAPGSAFSPPDIVNQFGLIHWGGDYTPVAALNVVEVS